MPDLTNGILFTHHRPAVCVVIKRANDYAQLSALVKRGVINGLPSRCKIRDVVEVACVAVVVGVRQVCVRSCDTGGKIARGSEAEGTSPMLARTSSAGDPMFPLEGEHDVPVAVHDTYFQVRGSTHGDGTPLCDDSLARPRA